MKKLIYDLLKGSFGKKRMQGFYESLFRVSLMGMNYGNGGDYNRSGELHVLLFLKEKFKLEKNLVIFDVGANVGNYSAKLASTLPKHAVVHSFEPSKKTFEHFRKTTSSLQNIIANNFGFGEQEDTFLLYTNAAGSGLASLYPRELQYMGVSMDITEEIHLSTIDKYCEQNNIERIHFLKLDVEGHEFKALKGASKMLTGKKIRYIQFEFGGTNIDSRTFFRDFYFLLNGRYKIYRIVTDGLVEVKSYDVRREIFESINYLAEAI